MAQLHADMQRDWHLWVEACAGQGACIQHGIGDGTRS